MAAAPEAISTFVLPPLQPACVVPESPKSQVSQASSQSTDSSWRLPEAASKLPLYVKRGSLVKLLGLGALQLAVVLCVAGVVRFCLKYQFELPAGGRDSESYLPIGQVMHLPSHAPTILLAEYYGLGAINLVLILLNWTFRSKYPCNYICLLMLTACMGSFWGVSCTYFASSEHLLLLAYLIVCLGMAALVCWAIHWQGACFQNAAAAALVAMSIGWTAAFFPLWLYVAVASPDIAPMHPWAICGWSLAAVFFMFSYVLHAILHGTATDDLIGLVGGMDACAMAVISLPYLLVLLACCVPSALEWTQPRPDEQSPPQVAQP